MKYWQEIRTAAHVARFGSIRAAARELNLHRATVVRHVDLLESALGIKLFLRHSRGYSSTDAALELLDVADSTERRISQIATKHRSTDQELSGHVTITATLGAARDMLPAVKRIALDHSELQIRVRVAAAALSLEDGEADIALRVGAKPELPDYIVQPLSALRFGLFASTEYVRRRGIPEGPGDLKDHYFAGPLSDSPRTLWLRWLLENVPANRLIVRCNEVEVLDHAVFNGTAIGVLPLYVAETRGNLRMVLDPPADWTMPIWLVTHQKTHQLARVQACLRVLEEHAHIFESR